MREGYWRCPTVAKYLKRADYFAHFLKKWFWVDVFQATCGHTPETIHHIRAFRRFSAIVSWASMSCPLKLRLGWLSSRRELKHVHKNSLEWWSISYLWVIYVYSQYTSLMYNAFIIYQPGFEIRDDILNKGAEKKHYQLPWEIPKENLLVNSLV